MQRKKADAPVEDWIRSGDWVAEQLRLWLQLLASQAQDQVNHFPPHCDIIGELAMDYTHFAEAIHTYWALSQEQTQRLMVLRDFLLLQDIPPNTEFWEEEALFSDPRWEEVRHLAKQALLSLDWPIEVPIPEKGSLGWKLMKRET